MSGFIWIFREYFASFLPPPPLFLLKSKNRFCLWIMGAIMVCVHAYVCEYVCLYDCVFVFVCFLIVLWCNIIHHHTPSCDTLLHRVTNDSLVSFSVPSQYTVFHIVCISCLNGVHTIFTRCWNGVHVKLHYCSTVAAQVTRQIRIEHLLGVSWQ